jgi:phosphoglucomutase
MTGDHCRDKDAVTAAMLVAEMAVWYAKQGLTLYGAMGRLYDMYGVYSERTLNLKFPGVDGLVSMRALMKSLRETPPQAIGGSTVTAIRDYQCGIRREIATGKEEKMELSNSNVLYFELADGCVLVIRPSGTEPKIKVYLLVKADNREVAAEKIAIYTEAAERLTEQNA